MKFAYTLFYVTDVAASLAFFERAFGLPTRFLHESGAYGEVDTGAGGTTLAFVDHAHRVHRVAAQEQVVDHAALQALVQFLMDHGNAVFQSVLRAGEVDLLAVEVDLALILLVGAEQALHHRGFTGAVFAHQAHDGAALHVQIDVVKHPVSAKRLAHAAN